MLFRSERLGVDRARVAVCHLGVDNEMFMFTPIPSDVGVASETDEAAVAAENKQRVADSTEQTRSVRAEPAQPAPETLGRPQRDGAAKLEVLYFGQYLPLHGLDVVVDAIGRLATREDLRFTLIGTGEDRNRVERLLRATRADVSFVNWVPYAELGARIARADITLGIFGSSAKARMVIPNKVYEAATVGAAIVTADTPAAREVFRDREHLLLCDANGASLAAAIAELTGGADTTVSRVTTAKGARPDVYAALGRWRLGGLE